MNETNLNNPTTTDELASALNKAVYEGNLEEVDRLMAVELPAPTEQDPPAEPVEEVVPEDNPDEKTNETPSSDDDQKDEAADEPDAASTPDTEGEQDTTVDIQALQAELHRLRSDVGRLPYLRRRTQELERELRDAKLNRSAGSTDPNAAPNNAKPAIPESLQKRINALKDIDPDLADTLEETITTLRSELDHVSSSRIKEVTEQVDARADEEFLQQQYATLVAEVPHAPQIFGSPEWKAWKEELTPARRAFAESQYADEVKIAISAFLNDMQARVQQQNGNVPATVAAGPTGVAPTTPQAPAVSKVQEARNRKMATGASTPSSVAAKSGSVPVDEEQLFKQFYKQIQKENHLG